MTLLQLVGSPLPVKQLKGDDPVQTLDLSGRELESLSGIVTPTLVEVNATLTDLHLAENALCGVGLDLPMGTDDALQGIEGQRGADHFVPPDE